MIQQTKLEVRLTEKPHAYEIRIGANVLPELGEFARRCLPEPARRVAIVSNKKVYGFYGAIAAESLQNAGFAVSTFLMPDGEQHKNIKVLQKTLEFFSQQKLTRADAVVALGGGVVGDLAGFAAAVFQRGIAYVQVPTTFLAQIDSSAGGKTAVNTDFGKNLVGAFHQPHGVLIDADTLQTLDARELRAGMFEAVKMGAIGDAKLFEQTKNFLAKFPPENFKQNFALANADFSRELQDLIAANVRFKAEIVAGDERETVARNDARSRKILNFGHTIGHALEKVTGYKRFKHGEAVGLGMRAAGFLSKRLGKISRNELDLFYAVLQSVGKLPAAADIAPEAVIRAFSHDKKSDGDSFKWILLDSIGRASIVDNKDIPQDAAREAVKFALRS